MNDTADKPRDCLLRIGRLGKDGYRAEVRWLEHVAEGLLAADFTEALPAPPADRPALAEMLRALNLWSDIWAGRGAPGGQKGTRQAAPTPDRLCLRIEAERLAALGWEAALHEENLVPTRVPIVRTTLQPPRAAQVPLTLPLRILRLNPSKDFSLLDTLRNTFGGGKNLARLKPIIAVRSDSAANLTFRDAPKGWKTVDVLHIDRPLAGVDTDRLMRISSPDEALTLGWLLRYTDVWRTRLVVLRVRKPGDGPRLRLLAHALVSRGGPAVWVVETGDGTHQSELMALFYDFLIHDRPLDEAIGLAASASASQELNISSLFAGSGREGLLSISTLGRELKKIGDSLRDGNPTTRANAAGGLWSMITQGTKDLEEAAKVFSYTLRSFDHLHRQLPNLQYQYSERGGMIPLGRGLEQVRRVLYKTPRQPVELRPTKDDTGPRYVNPGLWRLAPDGRGEPIPAQGARLDVEHAVVLGVQLGPRGAHTPVLDATALIEEPFKWDEGHAGVWLTVGVTGLDFEVLATPVQEVWLPRKGASDLIEFPVRPKQLGIAQLRLCVYHGADLLQSLRLAAIVGDTATAEGTAALADALDVAHERIIDVGWAARMEYTASSDLAAPPSGRDVALSIFANHIGGRRVVTIKGGESFTADVSSDPSSLSQPIRELFDTHSKDAAGLYAFRRRADLAEHQGSDEQLDAMLRELAIQGWDLFSQICAADQHDKIKEDLEGERRIIHVAHALLKETIPWAAIYDRRYDPDRTEDDKGRPVQHLVCHLAMGDKTGRTAPRSCADDPRCPLHPQRLEEAHAAGWGRTEDSVVCPRHFWGLRHILELPPYQDDALASTTETEKPSQPTTGGAPHRITATSAGDPAVCLLGYNASLFSAKAHLAELQDLTHGRKLSASWLTPTANRQKLLQYLGSEAVDLVYLFCHARGGMADPKFTQPVLELQEPNGQPGRIRPSALRGRRLPHHPLVILNGCNTATFSPDALSPFIVTLVRDCGAAGVLGTEIPVFEALAREVAKQFLERLLDGACAGEALLDTRLDLLRRSNPLGLIYTLYAVAELRIDQTRTK